MKLIICLLTVWFAAVVLALPKLPPGAYLEDDYIVLNPIEGRDDEPYYPDPYVFQDPNATYQNPGARAEAIEPPWSTGWNTERSPAHTMNASASTGLNVPMLAESFPSEPKILYAEARTGNERQHVGTLRKKRLEKAIYECLKLLCPLDDLNRGMNPCTPKNTKSCRVDHIVYNADPHPKYATNAHLEIYIDYAYHNPKFPGIGDAVYRAVASLYRLVADMEDDVWVPDSWRDNVHYPAGRREGSCYTVNFPTSRATKMCNVPRSASVGFPVNADHPTGDASEVQAMAAVALFFNGATSEGNYNTDHPFGAFEKHVEEVATKEWLPRFAKAIGRPESDLKLRNNHRAPKSTCMAWWWYENEKCRNK